MSTLKVKRARGTSLPRELNTERFLKSRKLEPQKPIMQTKQ